MNVPTELRYTKEHEWAKVAGRIVTVGITDYAQDSLGEVVFVEFPEVGSEVSAGDTFGVVESVKAVSDLFSPVSGKVAAVNEPLVEEPGIINDDPFGAGWMIKIEMSDEAELSELMDAAAYEKLIEEES